MKTITCRGCGCSNEIERDSGLCFGCSLRVLMVTTVVAEVAAVDVPKFLKSTKVIVQTTEAVTFDQQVLMHSFGGWTSEARVTSEHSPKAGDQIIRVRGDEKPGDGT